eukprot:m.150597 g.150597  ORF g.150597 m.150597 type:complete len:110 (-) comp14236_c0_seq2:881-1210(-)
MAERVLRQIHSLNHISQFVFVAVISSECLGQTQSVVSTFAVSDTSLSGYNRYSSTHILCLCRHAVVVIAVLRQRYASENNSNHALCRSCASITMPYLYHAAPSSCHNLP